MDVGPNPQATAQVSQSLAEQHRVLAMILHGQPRPAAPESHPRPARIPAPDHFWSAHAPYASTSAAPVRQPRRKRVMLSPTRAAATPRPEGPADAPAKTSGSDSSRRGSAGSPVRLFRPARSARCGRCATAPRLRAQTRTARRPPAGVDAADSSGSGRAAADAGTWRTDSRRPESPTSSGLVGRPDSSDTHGTVHAVAVSDASPFRALPCAEIPAL